MNAEELREIIQSLREVGADLTHIEVTKSDAQRLALAYVRHLAQSAEPYRVHVECVWEQPSVQPSGWSRHLSRV